MKKLIFCHFLMYEVQNGLKMTLKPKNNYRFKMDHEKTLVCPFWSKGPFKLALQGPLEGPFRGPLIGS